MPPRQVLRLLPTVGCRHRGRECRAWAHRPRPARAADPHPDGYWRARKPGSGGTALVPHEREFLCKRNSCFCSVCNDPATILNDGQAKSIVLLDSAFGRPQPGYAVSGLFNSLQGGLHRSTHVMRVMNQDQPAGADEFCRELKLLPDMFLG